jgi:Mrp family chromosome partitioning ATPase/capsular polysaccharide biosynthesis protein
MDASGDETRAVQAADWLKPLPEQEGLRRYLDTLRERLWVVVAAVLLTTGVAVGYVLTADKTYEAEADLLVTPVSSVSAPTAGLPLIRASSDPTRDVETAARLISNIDVAERVRSQLDSTRDPQSLLGDVSAEPVAQSNVVAVTAKAGTPDAARDLANAFAQQAVKDLTAKLHAQIDRTLANLRSNAEAGARVSNGLISQLETLRSGANPNLSVSTLARTPTSPASPRPVLSVAAGLLTGLVLGVAGAFASQALDPRLRREEQLRRLYRLPILARIPREPRRRRGKPIGPFELSPVASEAYRTLRATLGASRRTSSRGSKSSTILVTGSSPSEGKSTTAINLATSLATAGSSVILLEADVRRPAIGAALDVEAREGIVSVLVEGVPLQNALVTTRRYGTNLGLLLADYEGGWVTELFGLPAARELLDQAGALADYVVIDSPPLIDVIDALPLASHVDQVLVVTRLGTTRIHKLTQLGELLAANQIRPAGFALVGTPKPHRGEYYYYAQGARRIRRQDQSPAAREAPAPPAQKEESPARPASRREGQ